MLKQDYRKSDVDDNNRSASDYLSKLLNSRDFSNDLEGSPSTLSNSEANGFSYVPMKSNSSTNTRSSSVQKSSVATQKRNNRSSHKHKPAEVRLLTITCFVFYAMIQLTKTYPVYRYTVTINYYDY